MNESLEVQGIKRTPTIHLSRIDWQKELRGEHTLAGNKKRKIKMQNERSLLQRQLELEYSIDLKRNR